MKQLIFFFLISSTTLVKAQQEIFVGYDSFCGLPVVVGYDPQDASARTNAMGQKYIHVDPGVMSNTTMSRMFAIAHECAHHQLGHTSQRGIAQRYAGGTARQELEADCWAAERLVDLGYDYEVIRTVIQNANKGHFRMNGYPSGSDRAQNINQCAGRAGARVSGRVVYRKVPRNGQPDDSGQQVFRRTDQGNNRDTFRRPLDRSPQVKRSGSYDPKLSYLAKYIISHNEEVTWESTPLGYKARYRYTFTNVSTEKLKVTIKVQGHAVNSRTGRVGKKQSNDHYTFKLKPRESKTIKGKVKVKPPSGHHTTIRVYKDAKST